MFYVHVLEGGIRYDCSVNFRHNRATPLFEFTSEQYPMPEGTKIYAKLEYLNPGGSVKDRRCASSQRSNENGKDKSSHNNY